MPRLCLVHYVQLTMFAMLKHYMNTVIYNALVLANVYELYEVNRALPCHVFFLVKFHYHLYTDDFYIFFLE